MKAPTPQFGYTIAVFVSFAALQILCFALQFCSAGFRKVAVQLLEKVAVQDFEKLHCSFLKMHFCAWFLVPGTKSAGEAGLPAFGEVQAVVGELRLARAHSQ